MAAEPILVKATGLKKFFTHEKGILGNPSAMCKR